MSVFSQCVVYAECCDSETLSQFSTCICFLVQLLSTCHLLLNWMHKGACSNIVIVIYTVILFTVSKICVPPSSIYSLANFYASGFICGIADAIAFD